MTTTYQKIIYILFSFLSLFSLFACDSDDGVSSCFPNSDINAQYNLNLPAYSALINPGGYIEDLPNGTNGTRGLIIVNTGTGYRAYDRNAPHLCPGQNTTLEVEDDVKIICPSDSAEWILFSGQPLNDETLGRTPRQYNVSISTNTLTITN